MMWCLLRPGEEGQAYTIVEGVTESTRIIVADEVDVSGDSS